MPIRFYVVSISRVLYPARMAERMAMTASANIDLRVGRAAIPAIPAIPPGQHIEKVDIETLLPAIPAILAILVA